MADGLRVEIHGNVGAVIMDRPPHNFLNFKQIHDIADALDEMQNDMSIRCAVLAADGRSFCAGADFAGDGVGGGDDEVVGGDATLALYQGSGRLFDVTIPIVGAIHGPAVGGGLGLAMVPDIRITCPDARFSANFASLGKNELRALCKEHGIKNYGRMTNDMMRDALSAMVVSAAEQAEKLGLGVNAGHDLNLQNLSQYRQLPHLLEVSIGHALTIDSLDLGLEKAIKSYLDILH